jgi:hypothetical protein
MHSHSILYITLKSLSYIVWRLVATGKIYSHFKSKIIFNFCHEEKSRFQFTIELLKNLKFLTFSMRNTIFINNVFHYTKLVENVFNFHSVLVTLSAAMSSKIMIFHLSTRATPTKSKKYNI